MALPHETSEWQTAVDLARQGHLKEAEDAFLALADENPQEPGVWRWLANVSSDAGRRIEYMEKALALKLEDSSVRADLHKELMRRGVLVAQKSDLDEARRCFRRAIEVQPEDELARLWLVEVSEDLGERVEALESLLELRPQDGSVRCTLSRDLATQGYQALESQDRETARRLFRRAHKLDPENCDALLQLAMEPKRDLNERIEMLSKVMQSNPDSTPLRELWEDLTEQALAESSTLPVNLCGVCGSAKEPGGLDCMTCGAHLSLFDLERLLNNDRLNRPKVVESIRKIRDQLEVAEHWKLRKRLLLAYLNLGDRHSAMDEVQRLLEDIPLHEPQRLEVEQVGLFLQKNNPDDPIATRELRSTVPSTREIAATQEIKSIAHILVVDDSPTVQALVGATFEGGLHRLSYASTGMEALASLRHEIPDLVLLDIGLPNMDGYQLCRLIRQNPSTANVKVVMLSARDGFYDQVKARMVGCQDYVTKPFDPEQLQECVQNWLDA